MFFAFVAQSSIKSAATEVAKGGPVHLVFVATGVLQDNATKIRPEKSFTMLNAEAMAKVPMRSRQALE